MKLAFIVVIALALVPQIIFTVSYWRWIPSWIRNPYGRLAQLGSWCHIILLTLYLCFLVLGRQINPYVAEAMLLTAFLPLVFFGYLQLILLRKAVDSAKLKQGEESVRR